MNKIKKGDQVLIIAGKDKGKRGTVDRIITSKNRVVVEGINIAKRHTRGNPRKNINPAIVEKAMPLHVSNVMLYNSATCKGDHVGFRFLADGRKVRYFKSNNEII
ncbi:50S ribosomal subunit protein L24 [Gammaproteobacteria bacterium]